MASLEPWESRPDKQASKGVGVLIDTDYLTSTEKDYYENPYYLVVKGARYYGPTPEKVVEAVRAKIPENLKVGVPPVATEQVSNAIPSGRTMGSRAKNAASRAAQGTRNAASAAARGVKGAFAAAGKLFQKNPAANAGSVLSKPSGPTLKNRAMGSLKSAGTGMKSLTSKVGQLFTKKANASTLPGEGLKDPLLPKGGGRRRTRKSLRKSLRVSARA